MIELQFSKQIGALNLNTDLNLKTRQIYGVYGPSGSGKTTLFRILAGLAKVDHGRAQLDQTILFDTKQDLFMKPQHRSIGMVFQQHALFPHWTIQQNLKYAQLKPDNDKLVQQLINSLQLEPFLERRPQQLSGGQTQKVALAMTMLRQPKLILLDEPFSALDDEQRDLLKNVLIDLFEEYDMTMFIIAHQIGDLIQLADQIINIDEGIVYPPQSPYAYVHETTKQNPRLKARIIKILPNHLIILVGNNTITISRPKNEIFFRGKEIVIALKNGFFDITAY